MAWDKICRPKQNGGIGLHKTVALNQAYQSKLAWKICTNQNSMWVCLMRTKYLRHHDFFNAQGKQVDSLVWKNLLKCRKLIWQGLIWTVGNGKDIYFWQENWIETRSILDLLDLEDDDSVDLGLKVNEFIEDKQWNVHKLHIVLRSPALVQKVLGVPLRLTDINDSFCWGLSSSGSFTTKSAWLAQGVD